MVIDKQFGIWDYNVSTLLDDLAYFFCIQDFHSENYYEEKIPTQNQFIKWYKRSDYGIKMYKKANKYHYRELIKQKIETLNNI